jgi:hypothetical protein
MVITQNMDTPLCETTTQDSEREITRVRISRMSNPELLRFGMNVKLRLSDEPTRNDPDSPDLSAQLDEARLEWNRRHPNLPLRDSF